MGNELLHKGLRPPRIAGTGRFNRCFPPGGAQRSLQPEPHLRGALVLQEKVKCHPLRSHIPHQWVGPTRAVFPALQSRHSPPPPGRLWGSLSRFLTLARYSGHLTPEAVRRAPGASQRVPHSVGGARQAASHWMALPGRQAFQRLFGYPEVSA